MIKKIKSKKSLNAKRLTLNAKNGQVLVEAIVAITIATVGLLGIFSFISRSFSLNRVVADQYIGTYLAAEGIELTKNLIDKGEAPTSGIYEVDYKSTSLKPFSLEATLLNFDNGYYGYDIGGQQTRYTRVINIESGENDTRVISLVNWITRGGGKFNAQVEARFFNWKP